MDYLRWVFISTNSFFEIRRVTVLNGQICMVKFVRPKDNVCVWKHLDCASWTKTRKITTAKTWTVPDNFQRLINKFLGDLKKSGTFALKLYSSCVCFFRQAPALFIYTRQNKSSWKVLFTQRTFWCVPKHASQIYLSQGKNILVRISFCLHYAWQALSVCLKLELFVKEKSRDCVISKIIGIHTVENAALCGKQNYKHCI